MTHRNEAQFLSQTFYLISYNSVCSCPPKNYWHRKFPLKTNEVKITEWSMGVLDQALMKTELLF